jgi:hypothetical protein
VGTAVTTTPAVIDYSPAAEFADEVRAFAIIESGEDEYAVGGDAGQSYGLLQMHPATFKRYYGCQSRFAPNLNDTWTRAQIKSCAAFLAALGWTGATQNQRDLIVQAWNLGEAGVFIDGRRNPEYLARWVAAYDEIKGATHRS